MRATVVLSVLSSMFFGASDFFAGWAVRRLNVVKATTIAYAASGLVVVGALVVGGWFLSAGAGILLGAGNAALLLALHGGSLAVVSVLASLYPLGTILLASLVLRERIVPRQATGIGLAVVATVMLSLGGIGA